TLMVGIDSEHRVYWETRKFQIDNQDVPEAQVNYGYIDVADYGGVPLNGSSAPRLGIRRQLADDGSELRYFVVINGHQVPIRLQEGDPMLRNDIKNTALKAACGFFAVAAANTQASTEIERVRFIFDGGLGE